MRFTPVLKTAAGLAALSFAAALGGSALAQTPPTATPSAEEQPLPADTGVDVTAPAPPPTGRVIAPGSDVAEEASQPAGMPMSSPTPVAQAFLLKAGDPYVVSNAPVPDTPATRQAYGGPDSNGGKKTRPVGN